MAEAKAPEVKSTQQLDLEARAKDDYVSPLARAKTVGPNESLVSEDGFVGVDPMYQNYANETDAPLASESGPEKDLEDRVLGVAEEPAPEPAKTEEPKQTSTPVATPAASATPAN